MENIKLRELEFEDSFLLSEMIDKMGIADKLTELFDEAQKTKQGQEYFGKKLMAVIIKNWHIGKTEILEFVASITGITVEETRKLKFSQIKQILMDLVKDDQFKDFFNMAVEESK